MTAALVILALLALALVGPDTFRLYREVSRDRRRDEAAARAGLSPGQYAHYGRTLEAIQALPEADMPPMEWDDAAR